MKRRIPTIDFSQSKKRLVIFAAMLMLVLAAFSLRPVSAQTADVLDINSQINVTVAGQPDVSGDFMVDTNGNITMLYINQVHVAGLTIEQTRQKIAKALSQYYQNPQVVVRLVHPGGVAVSVSGAVTAQGDRVVRSDSRLNDVMQIAGPTLEADLAHLTITHGRPGEAKSTSTVNYLSFLNSQDPAGNPSLRDGDRIFVPRKEAVPIQINIRGAVTKPGRSEVPAKETVYDALQAAGGITIGANAKGVYILHVNTTDRIPFDYDAARQQPDNPQVNPVLLDGDTIVVPELEKPKTYTITGAVREAREFPLDRPDTTLADAIGRAGGLLDRPKLDQTTIVRTTPNGKTAVLKINAKDPTVQGNTIIQPGDNITIPQGSPPTGEFNPLAIIGTVIGLIAVFRR